MPTAPDDVWIAVWHCPAYQCPRLLREIGRQYGLVAEMEPGSPATIWILVQPGRQAEWMKTLRAFLAGITFERQAEWYGR